MSCKYYMIKDTIDAKLTHQLVSCMTYLIIHSESVLTFAFLDAKLGCVGIAVSLAGALSSLFIVPC